MNALARRGTTNRNARGNSIDRARRRAYLLRTFQSDQGPGTCRCYRCGELLTEETLTVDRIKPGTLGGRYTRENIRPACGDCNSETGGSLSTGKFTSKSSVIGSTDPRASNRARRRAPAVAGQLVGSPQPRGSRPEARVASAAERISGALPTRSTTNGGITK